MVRRGYGIARGEAIPDSDGVGSGWLLVIDPHSVVLRAGCRRPSTGAQDHLRVRSQGWTRPKVA